jgi:hypothetical protein
MSSWAPAESLIGDLAGPIAVERLPQNAVACRKLAFRLDCPCPATFIIVHALILQIFEKFNEVPITELQNAAIDKTTSFLALRIELACETGDPEAWTALINHWKGIFWSDHPLMQ